MQYHFLNCILDCKKHQLLINQNPYHLDKKAFDLLCYLVSNPDRAISRNELIETVWNRKMVSDEVLSAAIRRIRKAIQSQNKVSGIKTIRGLGYQLSVPVRCRNEVPQRRAFFLPVKQKIVKGIAAFAALILIMFSLGSSARIQINQISIGALIRPPFADSSTTMPQLKQIDRAILNAASHTRGLQFDETLTPNARLFLASVADKNQIIITSKISKDLSGFTLALTLTNPQRPPSSLVIKAQKFEKLIDKLHSNRLAALLQ